MALNKKFKLLPAIEFLKGIPNGKRDWKSKTPFGKWCYFYNCGRIASDFAGAPLFRENVKDVHWTGYISFIYIVFDILLSIYTLCYYMMHGGLFMGLPSTCLMSVFIAVRK